MWIEVPDDFDPTLQPCPVCERRPALPRQRSRGHVAARNTDPETSHLAAGATAGRRASCLSLLKAFRPYPEGVTAEESDDYAGHHIIGTSCIIAPDGTHSLEFHVEREYARRVSDLIEYGLIEDVIDADGKPVKRRSPRTGKLRMVRAITADGLILLDTLARADRARRR